MDFSSAVRSFLLKMMNLACVLEGGNKVVSVGGANISWACMLLTTFIHATNGRDRDGNVCYTTVFMENLSH